jgi:hypothetical protein
LNRQAVGFTSKNVDNIDKDNLLQYIILKTSKILVDSRNYWSFTEYWHMDPLIEQHYVLS